MLQGLSLSLTYLQRVRVDRFAVGGDALIGWELEPSCGVVISAGRRANRLSLM